MTVRNIVLYAQNEAALRKKSRPVRGMGQGVDRLVQDLKDTLAQSAGGVGLAAPQINVHRRLVVVCLDNRDGDGKEPNPPIAINKARASRHFAGSPKACRIVLSLSLLRNGSRGVDPGQHP